MPSRNSEPKCEDDQLLPTCVLCISVQGDHPRFHRFCVRIEESDQQLASKCSFVRPEATRLQGHRGACGGCFASHVIAMRKFLAQPEAGRLALIMEDDV